MTKVLRPHDYETSVFINCPFDSAYEPLLHGIIFAVLHMNLKPKPGIKLFSLLFLKCVSGSTGMVENLLFADFTWAVYDWINNNPA